MLRRLALLSALAAAPLAAQQEGWSVAGGLASGLDSLEKVTGNRLGLGVQVGWSSRLPETRVPFRLSLGALRFGAKDQEGRTTASLSGVQAMAEVLIQTPLEGWRVSTGLTVNRLRVADTPEATVLDEDKGVKMGFTVALEARLAPAWTAELRYQMVELGVATRTLDGGVNPAWIQAGVRWHF